jgi:hypothetical protein
MIELINYVGFEVSTAVVMKSIIFWDMTQLNRLHGVISQKMILFELRNCSSLSVVEKEREQEYFFFRDSLLM